MPRRRRRRFFFALHLAASGGESAWLTSLRADPNPVPEQAANGTAAEQQVRGNGKRGRLGAATTATASTPGRASTPSAVGRTTAPAATPHQLSSRPGFIVSRGSSASSSRQSFGRGGGAASGGRGEKPRTRDRVTSIPRGARKMEDQDELMPSPDASAQEVELVPEPASGRRDEPVKLKEDAYHNNKSSCTSTSDMMVEQGGAGAGQLLDSSDLLCASTADLGNSASDLNTLSGGTTNHLSIVSNEESTLAASSSALRLDDGRGRGGAGAGAGVAPADEEIHPERTPERAQEQLHAAATSAALSGTVKSGSKTSHIAHPPPGPAPPHVRPPHLQEPQLDLLRSGGSSTARSRSRSSSGGPPGGLISCASGLYRQFSLSGRPSRPCGPQQGATANEGATGSGGAGIMSRSSNDTGLTSSSSAPQPQAQAASTSSTMLVDARGHDPSLLRADQDAHGLTDSRAVSLHSVALGLETESHISDTLPTDHTPGSNATAAGGRGAGETGSAARRGFWARICRRPAPVPEEEVSLQRDYEETAYRVAAPIQVPLTEVGDDGYFEMTCDPLGYLHPVNFGYRPAPAGLHLVNFGHRPAPVGRGEGTVPREMDQGSSLALAHEHLAHDRNGNGSSVATSTCGVADGAGGGDRDSTTSRRSRNASQHLPSNGGGDTSARGSTSSRGFWGRDTANAESDSDAPVSQRVNSLSLSGLQSAVAGSAAYAASVFREQFPRFTTRDRNSRDSPPELKQFHRALLDKLEEVHQRIQLGPDPRECRRGPWYRGEPQVPPPGEDAYGFDYHFWREQQMTRAAARLHQQDQQQGAASQFVAAPPPWPPSAGPSWMYATGAGSAVAGGVSGAAGASPSSAGRGAVVGGQTYHAVGSDQFHRQGTSPTSSTRGFLFSRQGSGSNHGENHNSQHHGGQRTGLNRLLTDP